MRHRSLLACALVLTGPAAGCGAGQHPGGDPQSALHAYAHALEEGRAEDAYRLLSDEARRGISLEAFRRMVKDDREGVREIGRALERPTAPPLVTATVTSPSGQELHLVLEDGRWRVDATAIDLYAQDTPRHAIQGFVRAVERRRYDVVMRYVPEAHKEGLDASKLKTAWGGLRKRRDRAGRLGGQAGAPDGGNRRDGRARCDAVWGRDDAARARAWPLEDRELRLTRAARARRAVRPVKRSAPRRARDRSSRRLRARGAPQGSSPGSRSRGHSRCATPDSFDEARATAATT